MDLKMKAEDISLEGVYWDCKVEKGLIPIVTGDEEDLQCATMAGFLIKGTVPQLSDAGVPWTDFLTDKITFGVLDFYVRESLTNVGMNNFYPEYDIEEDKLTMSIGKLEQEDVDVI